MRRCSSIKTARAANKSRILPQLPGNSTDGGCP